MARDTIELSGLELDCILGVLPEEREHEQPVRVDLCLGLPLAPAGRSGSIAETIDYARVATEVTALLRFRRYFLIENAVEELSAMLFGVHPRLRTLELRLAKPRALVGRASSGAVRIQRAREDFSSHQERARFGEVDILLETPGAGLYLLHVEPGKEIPPHHHRIMRELEWLVAGELTQQGIPVPMASPVEWARGEAHSYRNETAEVATLFCCDRPPFIPSDEIELPAVSR